MPDPRRWLPFLQWPRPDAALLRSEAMAALTVAVVAVPQSVAYAGLAGMPLVTGLYAIFLPLVLSVLFSRSTRLSVGPTALSSVLVGASLMGMAEPGGAQWVALAVWLALLSGVVQLAVGALRASWVLNLVSSPVLTGFTQAAALLIIASQLPALVGLKGPLGTLFTNPQAEPRTLAFGVASLALLLLARKFWPRAPAVLVVVVAAAGLGASVGYAAYGKVVGALPQGLPQFYLPPLLPWDTLSSLFMPALVIALVSSLEMASSAKVENQRDGKRWDADQDLIGQGVGKLAGAFTGAFPTSASFSRAALTLYAGARTGWTTVGTFLVVLAVLLWFTPALYHVPQAVLAAIVVAAVASLLKPTAFVSLWRIGRVEAATAGVTFIVTLLSAPRIYWGVLAGVLMGLAHFMYHRLHPRIIEVGLHPDGSLRDRHLWELPPLAQQVVALRMDSALDFGSAPAFERAVSERLAGHADLKGVLLFAQPINRIDATGVETFLQVRRALSERGITLHAVGMKLPVEQALRRGGALDEGPLLRLYRTDAEALEALGVALPAITP
ncbi:MAG: SulP family inorganic anion transporter [Burkholderiales bacterium]|nr:SulP family inorganic anion transporter [Burkholderiales bacterium]